jgi:hypothetical protein
MKSHLLDDKEISELVLNVEKHPLDSLRKIDYKFNFKNLSIPETVKCEEIVGVDGSVKLITERINYFDASFNNYQTYVIDPIIFIRSISVHSTNPFIKEDGIVIQEKIDQFPLKYPEFPDRNIALKQMESNLLKSMELDHIKELVDEIEYGAILLLDMALISIEDDIKMKSIIDTCQNRGINVVGWVKDSDIKTKEGLLYTAAAKSTAICKKIKPPWYAVHPAFEEKKINVFLYHPPWGNFVFRIDVVNSSLSLKEIFDTLISCSKHSLGYPLVLYKAHQRVKITQNDANNMFRKMKKIAASNGIFIDQPGMKPFHETYLDL